MKKILCLLFLAPFALSACVLYCSPIKGGIYTNATVQGKIHLPKIQAPMVEGRATATGVLGFVSGDCSYEAALRDALQKSGAKGLTNIVVDHQIKNLLFIYGEYTTIVKGNAIR